MPPTTIITIKITAAIVVPIAALLFFLIISPAIFNSICIFKHVVLSMCYNPNKNQEIDPNQLSKHFSRRAGILRFSLFWC